MSIERVQEFSQTLPPRLRDDVVSYARSVDNSMPDIFRDAGVTQNELLAGQLVFLAGLKKLYAICSGSFWILDNSLESLHQADAHEVKIGSMRISRGSREYRQLQELLADLDEILVAQNLDEVIKLSSYAETLHWLQNEH